MNAAGLSLKRANSRGRSGAKAAAAAARRRRRRKGNAIHAAAAPKGKTRGEPSSLVVFGAGSGWMTMARNIFDKF